MVFPRKVPAPRAGSRRSGTRVLRTPPSTEGLDYGATPSLGLSAADRAAGAHLLSPWTTGGGVGVILLDELWVLVDFKVHRYQVSLGTAGAAYSTVSLGGEIGWRYFLWRGAFVQPVIRYWPTIYSSVDGGAVQLGSYRHQGHRHRLRTWARARGPSPRPRAAADLHRIL
jgi:hypothetical protein